MYDTIADLQLRTDAAGTLSKFGSFVSREVAAKIVTELASAFAPSTRDQTPRHETWAKLSEAPDVDFCLQCAGYGLSLSFVDDYATIRDCVRIYCEWLGGALLAAATDSAAPVVSRKHTLSTEEDSAEVEMEDDSVPKPIRKEPVRYASLMLDQLTVLFIAQRHKESNESLRQAKECHAVLRCIENITDAYEPSLVSAIVGLVLAFCLKINDALLSPNYMKEDLSEQLSERVLGVLFKSYLWAASVSQFPTPSHWKTLQTYCYRWRHRGGLLRIWSLMVNVLTHHIVLDHRSDYPAYVVDVSQANLNKSLADYLGKLSKNSLRHFWFRILYLIHRPTRLLDPLDSTALESLESSTKPSSHVLQQTINLYQYALAVSSLINRLQGYNPSVDAEPASLAVGGRQTKQLISTLPDRPSVDSLCQMFSDQLLSIAVYALPQDTTDGVSLHSSSSSASLTAISNDTAIRSTILDARTVALTALCKIFYSVRATEAVASAYLSRLYCLIKQLLQQNDVDVIVLSLAPIERLFLSCLPAYYVLAEPLFMALTKMKERSYVHALQNTAQPKSSLRTPNLNTCWLRLASLLLSIHNGFSLEDSNAAKTVEDSLLWYLKNDTDTARITLCLAATTKILIERHSTSPDNNSLLLYAFLSTLTEGLRDRWSSTYSICYAVLDSLSTLVRLTPDALIAQNVAQPSVAVTHSLCAFTDLALAKPPPAHSRELHSLIVYAYFTLSQWVVLLRSRFDQSSHLRPIVRTIQNGLYGVRADGEVVTADERPNPTSRRVRDSAEMLRNCLFNAHLLACTTESSDVAAMSLGDAASREARHYVLDERAILTLRQSKVKKQLVHLTVRSGVGRSDYDLEFDAPNLNTEKTEETKKDSVVRLQDAPHDFPRPKGYFPLEVDKFPKCNADLSIPTLDDYISQYPEIVADLEVIKQAWDSSEAEWKNVLSEVKNTLSIDMLATPYVEQYDFIRVLLVCCAAGALNGLSQAPRLLQLSSEKAAIQHELAMFDDRSACRAKFECSFFYVRSEATLMHEILSNGSHFETTLASSYFARLLYDFGEEIHREASAAPVADSVRRTGETGAKGRLDGVDRYIRWFDNFTELHSTVPSLRSLKGPQNTPPRDRSFSQPKNSNSLDLTASMPRDRMMSSSMTSPSIDGSPAMGMSLTAAEMQRQRRAESITALDKVIVLWLERYEDLPSLPLDALTQMLCPGTSAQTSAANTPSIHVVVLTSLQNSLVKLHMFVHRLGTQPGSGDSSLHIPPLYDACLVHEDLLPAILRETILNAAFHRRLANESWQLPQVRQQQRVKEIAQTHGVRRDLKDAVIALINNSTGRVE